MLKSLSDLMTKKFQWANKIIRIDLTDDEVEEIQMKETCPIWFNEEFLAKSDWGHTAWIRWWTQWIEKMAEWPFWRKQTKLFESFKNISLDRWNAIFSSSII